MQKTLVIKLTIIAGLCLILAIGLNMFRSVIYERQDYADSVVKEIIQQHVNPQEVITPFIAVPQTVTSACKLDEDGEATKCASPYTIIKTVLAKQTQAQQNLDVSTDTYQRGIYHATSYNGNLTFNQNYQVAKEDLAATQDKAAASDTNTNASTPNDIIPEHIVTHWNEAKLILPVSDLRGVATLPTVSIAQQQIKATYPETSMLSGLSYVEVALPTELLAKDPVLKQAQNTDVDSADETNSTTDNPQATDLQATTSAADATFDITVALPLSGIGSLNTVPTGQNFELSMTSNWHAPKFIGKALPNKKEFTNAGFVANWQNQYLTVANNQRLSQCLSLPKNKCVIRSKATLADATKSYNRAMAYDAAVEAYDVSAEVANTGDRIQLNSFAVSFAEPNDVYLQTERTMKYALLLILVSFGTFFLFEIIKLSRIHPIQYFLVGCALLVFYVLLLPLAEQIAFWKAYLIAAIACVGLIGWYAYYMLGSVKRATIFTAILAGLYAAFYGILTTEDLNLLLGAIFCFVLLAAVMAMTRKIDWYQVT